MASPSPRTAASAWSRSRASAANRASSRSTTTARSGAWPRSTSASRPGASRSGNGIEAVGADQATAAEAEAAELRARLLRGVSATDRRLRLRRALKALTWLGAGACLWLLATWLLVLGAGAAGPVAALWPSWAGGAVLVLLFLREAAALGRDLPAAARALDRAGDLHDAAATALEMQRRMGEPGGGRQDENARRGAVWPLPWIALVLRRAVAGLDRTGPRRTVPRLVPPSALPSAGICFVLLLPGGAAPLPRRRGAGRRDERRPGRRRSGGFEAAPCWRTIRTGFPASRNSTCGSATCPS